MTPSPAEQLRISHGEEALAGIRTLLASDRPLLALELDNQAHANQHARLMVLASHEQCVAVDLERTPAPIMLWESAKPIATYHAKKNARVFLKQFGQLPQRWACIYLSEQLILQGESADLHLPAIAARYLDGVTLPDADTLKGMANRALLFHQIVTQQAQKIKSFHLSAVSKLEAQAVAPIAAMEHLGMPFNGQQWRAHLQVLRDEQRGCVDTIAEILPVPAGQDLFGDRTHEFLQEPALKRALHDAGYGLTN